VAAVDDLLAARFPAIAWGAGGYESYYLKAAHPSEPKAVWIRHTVYQPQSAFVGWVYGDPDGSEHHTVNCSVADLELEMKLRTRPSLSLRAPARAVYELGMRERDHGMEIQRYPDG